MTSEKATKSNPFTMTVTLVCEVEAIEELRVDYSPFLNREAEKLRMHVLSSTSGSNTRVPTRAVVDVWGHEAVNTLRMTRVGSLLFVYGELSPEFVIDEGDIKKLHIQKSFRVVIVR